MRAYGEGARAWQGAKSILGGLDDFGGDLGGRKNLTGGLNGLEDVGGGLGWR